MGRRLYLLRHAKSSWKQPDVADHDRPLAGRGRRAAKAIGRHLAENEISIDLVLCSTARRARETLERIAPALRAASVRYERGVYAASADGLLELVHAAPDETGSLMLIGHNPSLEQLARTLARPSPRRRELEQKFPTGALATLEFDAPEWGDLEPGGADLAGFVRPREFEK